MSASQDHLARYAAAYADLARLAEDPKTFPRDAPRLESWLVMEWGLERRLRGRVFGHPRLRDGATIMTSEIVGFGRDFDWARTLNRFYLLGEPAAPGEGGRPP